MISTTYPVCEAGKWCPHTDSNRGPPDYKFDLGRFTGVHNNSQKVIISHNSLSKCLFLFTYFSAIILGCRVAPEDRSESFGAYVVPRDLEAS